MSNGSRRILNRSQYFPIRRSPRLGNKYQPPTDLLQTLKTKLKQSQEELVETNSSNYQSNEKEFSKKCHQIDKSKTNPDNNNDSENTPKRMEKSTKKSSKKNTKRQRKKRKIKKKIRIRDKNTFKTNTNCSPKIPSGKESQILQKNQILLKGNSQKEKVKEFEKEKKTNKPDLDFAKVGREGSKKIEKEYENIDDQNCTGNKKEKDKVNSLNYLRINQKIKKIDDEKEIDLKEKGKKNTKEKKGKENLNSNMNYENKKVQEKGNELKCKKVDHEIKKIEKEIEIQKQEIKKFKKEKEKQIEKEEEKQIETNSNKEEENEKKSLDDNKNNLLNRLKKKYEEIERKLNFEKKTFRDNEKNKNSEDLKKKTGQNSKKSKGSRIENNAEMEIMKIININKNKISMGKEDRKRKHKKMENQNRDEILINNVNENRNEIKIVNKSKNKSENLMNNLNINKHENDQETVAIGNGFLKNKKGNKFGSKGKRESRNKTENEDEIQQENQKKKLIIIDNKSINEKENSDKEEGNENENENENLMNNLNINKNEMQIEMKIKNTTNSEGETITKFKGGGEFEIERENKNSMNDINQIENINENESESGSENENENENDIRTENDGEGEVQNEKKSKSESENEGESGREKKNLMNDINESESEKEKESEILMENKNENENENENENKKENNNESNTFGKEIDPDFLFALKLQQEEILNNIYQPKKRKRKFKKKRKIKTNDNTKISQDKKATTDFKKLNKKEFQENRKRGSRQANQLNYFLRKRKFSNQYYDMSTSDNSGSEQSESTDLNDQYNDLNEFVVDNDAELTGSENSKESNEDSYEIDDLEFEIEDLKNNGNNYEKLSKENIKNNKLESLRKSNFDNLNSSEINFNLNGEKFENSSIKFPMKGEGRKEVLSQPSINLSSFISNQLDNKQKKRDFNQNERNSFGVSRYLGNATENNIFKLKQVLKLNKEKNELGGSDESDKSDESDESDKSGEMKCVSENFDKVYNLEKCKNIPQPQKLETKLTNNKEKYKQLQIRTNNNEKYKLLQMRNKNKDKNKNGKKKVVRGVETKCKPKLLTFIENKGGMYKNYTKNHENLLYKMEIVHEAFPDLKEKELSEIIQFGFRVKERRKESEKYLGKSGRRAFEFLPSSLNEKLSERQRRKLDKDIITRESQKFRSHRGRFQMLFAKTEKNPKGILTKEQWQKFLDYSNLIYRKNYFDFFTSEQRCVGSFNGEKCPVNAKIDFLYASSVERTLWTLDHVIEVNEIFKKWTKKVEHNEQLEMEYLVFLCLSVFYSEKFGKPNLVLRCPLCDSSKKHWIKMD
ncbi:hypothetical protein M0813_20718 [Anaeramoeba flamelloides]|uniref:Uncharacterized protein n=1 Tax=Anaeramoeba flamelloides TaxID=1746091 RepID=A0ABQ8YKK4_9EUKA|nr:hypothetical protein M0813_20718 [Anaeramoeba flamelloides]